MTITRKLSPRQTFTFAASRWSAVFDLSFFLPSFPLFCSFLPSCLPRSFFLFVFLSSFLPSFCSFLSSCLSRSFFLSVFLPFFLPSLACYAPGAFRTSSRSFVSLRRRLRRRERKERDFSCIFSLLHDTRNKKTWCPFSM